jgi:hypothetical protein
MVRRLVGLSWPARPPIRIGMEALAMSDLSDDAGGNSGPGWPLPGEVEAKIRRMSVESDDEIDWRQPVEPVEPVGDRRMRS